MRIDSHRYQRILGDELRRVRKRQGWTRKELNRHLDRDISVQTLATYELGTRHCSVVRLAEICFAMDELPHDLLARVHARLFTSSPGQIDVDLAKVVRDSRAELLPLRRWARDRLNRENGGRGTVVHLDPAAVERMAELCGLTTIQLLEHLRTFSGPDTPSDEDPVDDDNGELTGESESPM
ncbi:Helix-turn-helix domain-containing protein [Haloechinothrix alba]|uniref:Helix-turn-helix domain-containing protein n=1 Tax=Haloechinothrix alba TaxID=664784 RepID=A0A238ZBB8_9PSEU|nr:helix-turn-helix transcriptional regulator [Haloechinothrix alba]SNR80359.1 Helix-turn-helix domain-containing protein [Haloechinothrix alba]